MKLVLVVAVALIDPDDRVLISQRPDGKALAGLWEFPGGKVEAAERPEQALIRELVEELGIIVAEPCLAPLTFASHAYPDFHLLMPLYICRRWEGFATGREGQALKWVRPRDLRAYPMPPADAPLIPALIDIVGLEMATPHRLPSLNALRAFEAVAHRLSFARAAEDLHVTKAAVAQQVRLLEAEIGVPLVRRSGRGLSLTEAGQAGVRDLTEGFARLASGARRMREARGRELIVISAGASFAATWLVRRIGRFKQEFPEIDVLLDAARSATEMDREGIDAFIVWGTGEFPGYVSVRLFEEHAFPVCSPRLLEGEHPLRDPADLAHQTLLHLEWDWHHGAWPDWEAWLNTARVRNIDVGRGIWFNQMSIALEAAIQGQGVALSTRALSADEIRQGHLVAPFATSVETPFGYYFVCRAEQLRSPKFNALRQWLIEEAARSQV